MGAEDTGMCDDDRASCWCPPGTAFGREPAPPGSPPWVRYAKRGRAIMESCKPGLVPNKEGKMVHNDWGNKAISLDDLLGPKGFCNAKSPGDAPTHVMSACGGWRGCQGEGVHGTLCDGLNEETCLNQCTGHGDCDAGFCKCHPYWYGHECARKKAGFKRELGIELNQTWLRQATAPVLAALPKPPLEKGMGGGVAALAAAAAGASMAGRLRPLIYVYDMPPEFTSRMHQYKHVTEHCGWRQWRADNNTQLFSDNYSLEVYFHEMLAISHHRTYDPEEADFFYVPVYYCCWMWPVNGWADTPFFGAPTSWHRPSNAAHLWLAAKNWIQKTFPFWDRNGGRDHIWLTNHDEGACYMPTGGGGGPGRGGPDLVIPGFKEPEHYSQSPLLGAAPLHRDILLYLRGDVGKHRQPHYSRGIRQKLYALHKANGWALRYGVYIGDKFELQGSYGEHLARSVFCVVVPGDGFSMRMEDAVLHGCLPLIIQDRVHTVFETVLDIDSFSIRITEDAVDEHLPRLLKAIAPEQIERMQRKLSLVWHRFAYAHGHLLQYHIHHTIKRNVERAEDRQETATAHHPQQQVRTFPVVADAFATVMQWLHSRIKDTGGGGAARKSNSTAAATAGGGGAAVAATASGGAGSAAAAAAGGGAGSAAAGGAAATGGGAAAAVGGDTGGNSVGGVIG
ncbi:hypothetical protein GPECTOR_27g709 [Gonium pectorale]|uniref:Exostosin GT47 domain-containing protein n=1 Tax=Gonium pectorale TaxID=33097 RepID=A0A150GFE0_GONPE|nr:hypothetical protein GPECTOR_27g709 [Gonium pectorale]|eukprot:KXZ48538.1 hypothetical protein GPECTOR_27g709 [Gonium pectorale]